MEFKAIHLATKLGGDKEGKDAETAKCSCCSGDDQGDKGGDKGGGKGGDKGGGGKGGKGGKEGLAVLQQKLREKLGQDVNAGV